VEKIKADRSSIDELLIYLADRLTYAHWSGSGWRGTDRQQIPSKRLA